MRDFQVIGIFRKSHGHMRKLRGFLSAEVRRVDDYLSKCVGQGEYG